MKQIIEMQRRLSALGLSIREAATGIIQSLDLAAVDFIEIGKKFTEAKEEVEPEMFSSRDFRPPKTIYPRYSKGMVRQMNRRR